MATMETIRQQLKKRKAAVNLARSISDFACKAAAELDTQDFLWNRYQFHLQQYGDLQSILAQVGTATLVLQRAAEWRSVGVYTAEVLDTLRDSYLPSSERVFKLRHQELIDKASQEQELAMAELARLFKKAEPYLSA
jgi:predicted PolB exonuclease-like 3'-5' exonuclease